MIKPFEPSNSRRALKGAPTAQTITRQALRLFVVVMLTILLTGCQGGGPPDDVARDGLAFTLGNFRVNKVELSGKQKCALLFNDAGYGVTERWLVTGMVYFDFVSQGTLTSVYVVKQDRWRYDSTTSISSCRRQ
jgi:hypothetical protein